ncbi:hypothetical protein ABEB36_002396 [Hypothenemus hampei]|uniref:beta-N-acetylhexosaminidase n=1 Tax=Hypothenemus hampei TaxID=57062 RepID=A0ABD1F5L0_HYPHA
MKFRNRFNEIFKFIALLGVILGVCFVFLYIINSPKKISSNVKYDKIKLIRNPIHKQTKNLIVEKSQMENKIHLPERIVHLDLKGAPPKVSYYSELFPLLSTLGATGLLLEYEDMFPFSGELKDISALNAYTVEDIAIINSLAKKHKLKIIPFVQIFDHLEYVLKLVEFIDYREIRNFPSTICPSHDNTKNLIMNIIEQIIILHPDVNKIHLGCDAVSNLGQCQLCTNRMISDGLTKNQLFLKHIASIIDSVKKRHPTIEILIWDDHFRTLQEENFKSNSIFKSFKPVIWWYGKNVYDELGPSLWSMYSNVFSSVWLASAYKGTTRNIKYVSDVNHYLQNLKSWISVIREYNKTIRFEGIILTGWQRFDHFSALCELLPVGLPTLAMSLRLLQGHKDPALGPPIEVAKILQCYQPYGLIGAAFGSPKCKFPGGEVLENVVHLHQLQQEFSELIEDSRAKSWLSEFNKAHVFSNPSKVKAVLFPLDKIKSDLDSIKVQISNAILQIYDQYTLDEWLQTYLLPFEKEVSVLSD